MKPNRRRPSGKKDHAKRERALAIAARPERYGEEGKKWLRAHKHLIDPAAASRQI